MYRIFLHSLFHALSLRHRTVQLLGDLLNSLRNNTLGQEPTQTGNLERQRLHWHGRDQVEHGDVGGELTEDPVSDLDSNERVDC